MDTGLQPDWNQFRPSNRTESCPACGQSCLPGRTFCGVCSSHVDTAVLRICRSLLLEAANADEPEDKESDSFLPDREVAVSFVADHFPVRFARLIGRNASSLKKAGAWFAHVLAFQHAEDEQFQYRAVSPDRIFRNRVFKDVRNQIYEAIYAVGTLPNDYFLPPQKNKEEKEDNKGEEQKKEQAIPALETLFSYFNTGRESESGPRQLLFDMISDLERRGKLRVNRGSGTCRQCGISLPGGASLCPSCRQADQAMARLSIAWKKGTEKMKSPEEVPTKTRGRMHHRSDS